MVIGCSVLDCPQPRLLFWNIHGTAWSAVSQGVIRQEKKVLIVRSSALLPWGILKVEFLVAIFDREEEVRDQEASLCWKMFQVHGLTQIVWLASINPLFCSIWLTTRTEENGAHNPDIPMPSSSTTSVLETVETTVASAQQQVLHLVLQPQPQNAQLPVQNRMSAAWQNVANQLAQMMSVHMNATWVSNVATAVQAHGHTGHRATTLIIILFMRKIKELLDKSVEGESQAVQDEAEEVWKKIQQDLQRQKSSASSPSQDPQPLRTEWKHGTGGCHSSS